jgi:hydroxylaminobenzene mutase
MSSADWSQHQGHRLIQIGCLLFLVALLVGIMVPSFAVPRLGLSTHLLGITQGIFLMVIGLVWPRLRVPRPIGTAGMFLVLYGCFAPWTANLLAAILGAGNPLLPLAAGPARGTALQEGIIAILLRSGAMALIAALLFILWGLRGLNDKPSPHHPASR